MSASTLAMLPPTVMAVKAAGWLQAFLFIALRCSGRTPSCSKAGPAAALGWMCTPRCTVWGSAPLAGGQVAAPPPPPPPLGDRAPCPALPPCSCSNRQARSTYKSSDVTSCSIGAVLLVHQPASLPPAPRKDCRRVRCAGMCTGTHPPPPPDLAAAPWCRLPRPAAGLPPAHASVVPVHRHQPSHGQGNLCVCLLHRCAAS